MEHISYAKSFEFFQETLGHCGMFLLNENTENIEWHMFEEFDGDSITFLHEYTLDRLLEGGYISAEIYSLCQLLRQKFRSLEGTNQWNVEAVRSAPEWCEILSLADKIKNMINTNGIGDGL